MNQSAQADSGPDMRFIGGGPAGMPGAGGPNADMAQNGGVNPGGGFGPCGPGGGGGFGGGPGGPGGGAFGGGGFGGRRLWPTIRGSPDAGALNLSGAAGCGLPDSFLLNER